MHLIDSHAHLTYPELSRQMDGVLSRCAEEGVGQVITIGTSLSDAEAAIALSRQHPGRIHAAVGFHPHHANEVSEADLARMSALWETNDVAALGEMGLDYHYDFADRNRQRDVFAGQLRHGARRDKPVIIHCREAFADVVPMLIAAGFEGRRVVFHCFTGSAAEAEQVARHGWRISFTGVVTFPKSDELREIARAYPADQMMVETDSPYLSPAPVRSKKPNEPSFVAHTTRFLAELRGEKIEDFAERTTRNTREFFGL